MCCAVDCGVILGTTTSILTLKNIQANERLGPYEFQLDVKDTKGQKDSARISIFVNKAENFPPGGFSSKLLAFQGFLCADSESTSFW